MTDHDTTAGRDDAQACGSHFPPWIWGVYLLLFGASVPWYIPADAPLRLWLGLPHWVVLSLLASIGVAGFTAFVVHRLWPEQEPPAS